MATFSKLYNKLIDVILILLALLPLSMRIELATRAFEAQILNPQDAQGNVNNGVCHGKADTEEEGEEEEEKEEEELTLSRQETEEIPQADPNVETAVVYLDHVFNTETRAWAFRNTSIITPAELYDAKNGTPTVHTTSDAASKHCLSFVREVPSGPFGTIEFSLAIISPHLLRICEKLIGDSAGVSWNAKDVKVYKVLPCNFG